MLPGWTKTAVGGKPADVFRPAGPPRFAVLFLHPVGQESPADNAAYTELFQMHGLAVVAPWGGESWWADRIDPAFDPTVTAEQHLLQHVVPWMEREWSFGPRAIAVAGISMGGQGAVRLGFKYPDRFPVVVGVASAFDYYERHGRGTSIDAIYPTKEKARQDGAGLHVNPLKFPPHVWFACDPDDAEWFRGNDRLHEKLRALGIPHTVDFDTSHGGHNWDYFDAMAGPMVEFIMAGLEKESRRLV
jgi:S-formylglutathione hydrolase FrmB